MADPDNRRRAPRWTREALVELIGREHIAGGRSLRSIERDLGIGKTVLSAWCRRYDIAVRSQPEASGLAMRETVKRFKGENHWAWGHTKHTHRLYAWASARMKADNPGKLGHMEHRRRLAKRGREQPAVTEGPMVGILAGRAVHQHVIGPYVIDFAFPTAKVALEMDGRGHASRKQADLVKDLWLLQRGWVVIRCEIDPRLPFNPLKLCRILEQHVAGLDLVGALPAGPARQYRVLVREPQNPAGVRL